MNAELDLKKIYAVAKGIACARGCSEFAEDIAQEVCIKVVELGFKPNIKWEIANILRKEYGDLRTGTGRAKQRGTRYATRLDAPVSDDSETLGHDLIGSEFVDPLPEPGVERFTGLFQGIEATVFEMHHLDDEDQGDIANIYGITPARVCQINATVKLKIIKAMLPEEYPDEMNFELGDLAL